METKHVYQAITEVAAELAREGISKDRNNAQQGYKFRGIDDVYNALAPILSRHALCVLPRVTSRECVERVNHKGTALFYVTVGVEFDFVSAKDGSLHTVSTYGEAMDSGDKATNKAMSAAYKYACMQAFCIPTEGDNDADATTHEVQSRRTLPETQRLDFENAIDVATTAEELDAIRAKYKAICEELGDADAFKDLTAKRKKRLAEIAKNMGAAA